MENNKENVSLSSIYGVSVFSDVVMRERLPKATYKLLRQTIDDGLPLDPSVAEVVANAMKDWAIQKGATHFTHWFQPMNGHTAEKHNSFIAPTTDGRVIMEFSGKELVKGEADASSFPSGGQRATFEARGYTAWDCTSMAFVKDETLYIPTAFCSFNGSALDQKTPLLRSMEVLSKHAVRVLRALGDDTVKKVVTMVGPEQEYFLVDKDMFFKRKDLLFCGRTLYGAKPPKGQEMNDHYYGNIKDRVFAFMRDVDEELWKLGVSAKTEHNEVAPAQHELAIIYTTANIASDHNQLTMDVMSKIALRHNLVCLMHEKPFQGVNGSGKHNNWSIATDSGRNLLSQGKTPEENLQFLTFMSAIIWAVDEYSDLLRLTVASPGNDHRLGGHEAPPAIISMYLGDYLTDMLEDIEGGGYLKSRKKSLLETGVATMPMMSVDTTDRNRTSPFAFDGKKFEFRMPGSSDSIAECNTIINAIVGYTLSQIADKLEKTGGSAEETMKIVRKIIKEHKKIIFNGNNYSDEWVEEAARRGLPNIASSVEAAGALIKSQNIAMMDKMGVLTPVEMQSRYEIRLENYVKVLHIEANTMVDMAKREIFPAASSYAMEQAGALNAIKSANIGADTTALEQSVRGICAKLSSLKNNIEELEKIIEESENMDCNMKTRAEYCRDHMRPAMAKARADGDKLETVVPIDKWPMPTYCDLLFKV